MNTQKHVFYGAEGRYVAEVDFDRVTAERDALQQLLNARDEEVERLRAALKFYADQDHFYHGDDNWDSVSGEPHNVLWHAEEPYSVENGWFARQALEAKV